MSSRHPRLYKKTKMIVDRKKRIVLNHERKILNKVREEPSILKKQSIHQTVKVLNYPIRSVRLVLATTDESLSKSIKAA